jgi:hypothetical protein
VSPISPKRLFDGRKAFADLRRSLGDPLPLLSACIMAILAIISSPRFSAAERRQAMAVCQCSCFVSRRQGDDVIGGIAERKQGFAFGEIDRLIKFQGPGHGRGYSE